MTDLQSKYIALHVELFWVIEIFTIKNIDHVKNILDEQNMFEHFIINYKKKIQLFKKENNALTK